MALARCAIWPDLQLEALRTRHPAAAQENRRSVVDSISLRDFAEPSQKFGRVLSNFLPGWPAIESGWLLASLFGWRQGWVGGHER
jgi:hypothetical protein